MFDRFDAVDVLGVMCILSQLFSGLPLQSFERLVASDLFSGLPLQSFERTFSLQTC